jgi:hypothetical protein
MAENENFYTDALKAFDAPAPEPEEISATAEETAPAPRETRRYRFSPCWFAALAVVLCLVLVMRWGHHTEIRGENCAWGIVLEQAEDHMIFTTGYENWFVKLDSLEDYDPQQDIEHCHVWFFYNGEPEVTLQKDCDKQITATYLVVAGSEYYKDELAFDLDRNGVQECWSIQEVHNVGMGMALRIQAEDKKGNILHRAYMDVDYGFFAVLSNMGNQLSLIHYSSPDHYENLDIRLEKGELAVYRRGEKQQLRQPSQEESYAVNFIVEGNISGRIELNASQGAALKKRLDTLNWSTPNHRDYDHMGIMNFFTADEQITYQLGYGDVLMWGSRVAEIDTEFYLALLRLMPWQMPKHAIYSTDLGEFETVSIYFREDGTASLWGWDPETGERKSYEGRYATLQGYASVEYHLFLGERFDQVVVMYQHKGKLCYRKSESEHTMFPVGETTIRFEPA